MLLGKTGFTTPAQYTFAASARNNNVDLIAVTLKAPLPDFDFIPTECKCDTKNIYDVFDQGGKMKRLIYYFVNSLMIKSVSVYC